MGYDVLIGFLVMGESFLHSVKNRPLISTYIFILMLLIIYCLCYLGKDNKIIGRIEKVIVVLIVFACIAGYMSYHSRYSQAYEKLSPGNVPVELNIHYHGALENRLYTSTLEGGERANHTPPTNFLYQALTNILGGDFETYTKNYRGMQVLAGFLTLAIMIWYTKKTLARNYLNKSLVMSIAVITFLFLFPLSFVDILWGNTNVFVGLLIAGQLLLGRWDNSRSRFLQGFILVLAWWLKPNISMVTWCMVVFALSRKKYEYLYGMVLGGLIPFLASLLAPNIDLETYLIFFTKIADVTEHAGDNISGNISLIQHIDYHPDVLYKICLILAALLVAAFTITVKGEDLLRYEILAFSVTYSCWTIFWDRYLITFAVVVWALIVNMYNEGKTMQAYLATAYMLALSWMTIARYDDIGVNLLLVGFALGMAAKNVLTPRLKLTFLRQYHGS